jgi:hypothetical protein
MQFLLESGVPASGILLLTPQRILQNPYLGLVGSPEAASDGPVATATVAGLAHRTLEAFWPLAAEAGGFAHPDRPPVFLNVETAQYYMAHVVRPHLQEGFFESVTMDRNRLYVQILDNLDKAASNGFSYTEIGERLMAAWGGDPAQRRVFVDVQTCANEFRQYCLEHNLLDFSLQLELFANILWNDPNARSSLTGSYHHLIYDNAEEDTAVGHDIVADWLPLLDSALVIFDEGGGYRSFLSADPQSALALADLCDETIVLNESFVAGPALIRLSEALVEVISPTAVPLSGPHPEQAAGESADVLSIVSARFYPEMLDAVADEIHGLVENGTPPSEIVVLAPYLGDALRFSLMNRLAARGVPARSHRPSRSLRDEPASQCLLTLAALAHPDWDIQPDKLDVTHAFMQAIGETDLVRVQMLAEIVYRQRDASLSSFERINPDMQERIGEALGSRYTALRDWLQAYRAEEPQPLDQFLRRLFDEVLSQPGFSFHDNLDSARVAASLADSVESFRMAMQPVFDDDFTQISMEYMAMFQEGVMAAQYLAAWNSGPDGAVLVAPAYTFLVSNRAVDVQFWLDVGSSGWHERMFQPLTHPQILSRHWPRERIWTDADELEANSETLARLLNGLIRRCRRRLYLGLTELDESGYEQRGALLRAFHRVLTRESE